MQPVKTLGGKGDSRVKTKRDDGLMQIVVDGLGDPHDP